MADYTALQVKAQLEAHADVVLLDVREDDERARAHITGDHLHIPLGELPDRVAELDRSRDLIVYCRAGGRSGQAVRYLKGEGFTKVHNLLGGILGWAAQVEKQLKP